jgi:DNA-binding MarR family transcriptional regulator
MSISISRFADKLNEAMPKIAKGFSRHGPKELFKGRITLPQFLVLEYLHRNVDSRMTDLARFMSVTTAAMTGIVDRLVKYSYAVREFEPKDRRVVKIRLTQKGAVLVEKIASQRRKMIISVFGKISGRDREDYLRVITKIQEILSAKT